jgi:hypothetical protein
MRKPPRKPIVDRTQNVDDEIFGIPIGTVNAETGLKLFVQHCIDQGRKPRTVTIHRHVDAERMSSPVVKTKISLEDFKKNSLEHAKTCANSPPSEDKLGR